MKILIAEDDSLTREGLIEVFENEGITTIVAENGEEALQKYRDENPDILCLDIMMPKINGYDVCREIRRENSEIPILFLSAKSEEIDTVIGLELGADDFIIKPFGVKAVVARVRAIVRRCLARNTTNNTIREFSIGDLRVISEKLRAYRNEEIIELSLRDVKILEFLYKNRGIAVDRNSLLDHCWGIDFMPSSRPLDQHISQLRKRIEIDPKNPVIIKTVHGVGYRYDEV